MTRRGVAKDLGAVSLKNDTKGRCEESRRGARKWPSQNAQNFCEKARNATQRVCIFLQMCTFATLPNKLWKFPLFSTRFCVSNRISFSPLYSLFVFIHHHPYFYTFFAYFPFPNFPAPCSVFSLHLTRVQALRAHARVYILGKRSPSSSFAKLAHFPPFSPKVYRCLFNLLLPCVDFDVFLSIFLLLFLCKYLTYRTYHDIM